MATRLYPNTNSPEILEKLAGVPAGTARKLEAIREKYQAQRQEAWATFHSIIAAGSTAEAAQEACYDHSVGEAEYNEISANPEVSRMDHFMVFGWSRLSPEASAIVAELGEDPCIGFWEKDRKEAFLPITRKILAAQGVRLPEGVTVESLEGINWN